MKITILGSGNMATAFVKQLSAAGHQVRVTGRNLAKASELAGQYRGVQSVAPNAAAQDADVIIVATPYEAAADALRSVGDVRGKVVIDITNPLTPDYMGLTIGHDTSAAERDRAGDSRRGSGQGIQHAVRAGAGSRRGSRRRPQGHRVPGQ